MMDELAGKQRQLLQMLERYPSCAVAYSGGVDSTVLAKAAFLALGDRAVAVTAVSSSLSQEQLDRSQQLARLIGIRQVLVDTREIENPDYVRNGSDRCYHCKDELYRQVARLQPELQFEVILNGANADDLHDHRPGMQAARLHQVASPLALCQISKQQVRQLAALWQLPNWDLPASPCLSSRVAYGEPVTAERLKMIEQAEQFLKSHGFEQVRVRVHRHDLARLEVPVESLMQFSQQPFRAELVHRFRQIGFTWITLDLEGFRSGNLNQLIPIESIQMRTLPIDQKPIRSESHFTSERKTSE